MENEVRLMLESIVNQSISSKYKISAFGGNERDLTVKIFRPMLHCRNRRKLFAVLRFNSLLVLLFRALSIIADISIAMSYLQ